VTNPATTGPLQPRTWLGAERIPAGAIAQAAAARAAGLLAGPADHRASRRLARALQPGREPEIRWISRTRTDLLVLRAADPAGDVVIKHPSSDRGTRALARHYRNLETLAADERLGDWRRLLPHPVTCDLDGPQPYTVEECRPGITAADLVRLRPEAADRIAQTALAAISTLHRATGALETPDPDRLRQWIDVPLSHVRRDVPACRTGRQAQALENVRARLYAGLAGHPILTSWTHGDFHPGNVLMNDDGTEVTGIIVWATAHPDGPAATDHHLFRLALRRETGGEELGTLVMRTLRGDMRTLRVDATGDASGDMRTLRVDATGDASGDMRTLRDGATGGDATGDDEDALLLLTWIRHIADNLNQSTRYPRNRAWLARNLASVLRAAAAG
jgi:aminoglycoside phosphotransferase (APT) family kinase protein